MNIKDESEVSVYNYDYTLEVSLNKRPLGVVCMNVHHDSLLIGPILVDAKYRRMGLGTKLIKKCEEIAFRDGFDYLHAFTPFEEVKMFFKSIGFSEYKTNEETKMTFLTKRLDVNG